MVLRQLGLCMQELVRGSYGPRMLAERPLGPNQQQQQQGQGQERQPEQAASRELRLVGSQVGCVLGKAGENITQIRKVRPATPLSSTECHRPVRVVPLILSA